MNETKFLAGESSPQKSDDEKTIVDRIIIAIYSIRKIQKNTTQQKTIRTYMTLITSPVITVHSDGITLIIKHLMRIHLNPAAASLRDIASSTLQDICLYCFVDVPRDGRLYDDTTRPKLSLDRHARTAKSSGGELLHTGHTMKPSPLAVSSTAPSSYGEEDSDSDEKSREGEPMVEGGSGGLNPRVLQTQSTSSLLLSATLPMSFTLPEISTPQSHDGKYLLSDCLAIFKRLCTLSTFDPEKFEFFLLLLVFVYLISFSEFFYYCFVVIAYPSFYTLFSLALPLPLPQSIHITG